MKKGFGAARPLFPLPKNGKGRNFFAGYPAQDLARFEVECKVQQWAGGWNLVEPQPISNTGCLIGWVAKFFFCDSSRVDLLFGDMLPVVSLRSTDRLLAFNPSG